MDSDTRVSRSQHLLGVASAGTSRSGRGLEGRLSGKLNVSLKPTHNHGPGETGRGNCTCSVWTPA